MALNVVSIHPETKELVVDEDGLKSILLDPKVKDLPVIVICVAGIFQSSPMTNRHLSQGKKFSLELFPQLPSFFRGSNILSCEFICFQRAFLSSRGKAMNGSRLFPTKKTVSSGGEGVSEKQPVQNACSQRS